MAKPKREVVSKEMRARLLTNRHGKLTTDQWKDMVTEPIIKLLLLMVPAVLLLGPLAISMTARVLWVVGLAVLIVMVIPLVFRARRYARAPVHFATLYAGGNPLTPWLFWQADVLYTQSGEAIRFGKRLAPFTILKPDEAYNVYYLREANVNVLLSLAPADHQDSDLWQPSESFQARQAQRSRI
jgi:hypothetical protein